MYIDAKLILGPCRGFLTKKGLTLEKATVTIIVNLGFGLLQELLRFRRGRLE